MVVGAKVCELTDGFLWFVCGLYVGILTSPLSYFWFLVVKPHTRKECHITFHQEAGCLVFIPPSQKCQLGIFLEQGSKTWDQDVQLVLFKGDLYKNLLSTLLSPSLWPNNLYDSASSHYTHIYS